jgi:uncharacterized protein YciI
MIGFVFRLIPPRPDFPVTMSEEERATMAAHAAYWASLAARGTALAYGPVNDPEGSYGIAIFLAEGQEEAERVRDADPALCSTHGFRSEITPMLSLVTPDARYDALIS